MRGLKNLTLAEVCAGIEDPRTDRVCKFDLAELLFVAMMTVLMGAASYVMMAEHARRRIRWFRRFMPFANGTPGAGTLRNVLGALDPKEVHRVFAEWMAGALDALRGLGAVALDGKTARGSGTDDQKPVHVAAAFMSAAEAALAQASCGTKGGEPAALVELLNMLDIHGCLVTIDAMGTRRGIAELITAGGADFLLPVKGNQPRLRAAVEAAVGSPPPEVDPAGGEHAATVSKGHGRLETRECFVARGRDWLGPSAASWPDVRFAALVRSTVESGEGVAESSRFYIGSREDMTAAEVLEAARGHWQAGKLHWILDVVFREDSNRTHSDHAAENLNVLRQIAHNVLKSVPGFKGSFPVRQAACLLDARMLSRAAKHMGYNPMG